MFWHQLTLTATKCIDNLDSHFAFSTSHTFQTCWLNKILALQHLVKRVNICLMEYYDLIQLKAASLMQSNSCFRNIDTFCYKSYYFSCQKKLWLISRALVESKLPIHLWTAFFHSLTWLEKVATWVGGSFSREKVSAPRKALNFPCIVRCLKPRVTGYCWITFLWSCVFTVIQSKSKTLTTS